MFFNNLLAQVTRFGLVAPVTETFSFVKAELRWTLGGWRLGRWVGERGLGCWISDARALNVRERS